MKGFLGAALYSLGLHVLDLAAESESVHGSGLGIWINNNNSLMVLSCVCLCFFFFFWFVCFEMQLICKGGGRKKTYSLRLLETFVL